MWLVVDENFFRKNKRLGEVDEPNVGFRFVMDEQQTAPDDLMSCEKDGHLQRYLDGFQSLNILGLQEIREPINHFEEQFFRIASKSLGENRE